MIVLRNIVLGSALAVLTILGSGCVGIYDNTERFLNAPERGLAEAKLLEKYGFPDFTTTLAGGAKVYGYKVRDVKYIIFVGVYEGHDLLVTTDGGIVQETQKIPRTKALSIFQPVPWAVTD